ncbi:four helix bundle protein [Gemmatimonas sp. UBA7669]|uniref:four helix bundle protein n=1 Tax=Gemmatimonas sp. UBA7669 TaxID=1946568 RepID=UPI0025C6FED9|nr:four helix bundle protein [Gemmatimonas sp. UBA7669]
MPHNPARLKVIDRAFALTVEVHRLAEQHADGLSARGPGLRSQMLRAADSVASNLTEAAAFDSPKRCESFLRVAIGSCNELELQLRLAVALCAFPDIANDWIDETIVVRKMIFGWRKYLQRRESNAGAVEPQTPTPTQTQTQTQTET